MSPSFHSLQHLSARQRQMAPYAESYPLDMGIVCQYFVVLVLTSYPYRGGGLSGPSDPHHESEKDNTIILTSKFVDSTPTSVSNLPKAQRMGRPGGGSSSIDPAMAEVLSRKS